VGVDDSLVKRKDFGTEDIVEMNNGCKLLRQSIPKKATRSLYLSHETPPGICCTVRGDLIRILTDLLKRKAGKFDHILIETTGLADPAPVAQTFFVHDELQVCRLVGFSESGIPVRIRPQHAQNRFPPSVPP